MIIRRLEDDSIGNNRGNYFAKMPGLDSLSGYTLAFFTGSWCGPCKPVLDSLLIFHKQHPEITIININFERDTLKFRDYLNQYQIPWEIILDYPYPWKYKDTYNSELVPTLFLINPQRKILKVVNSRIPCSELLQEIKEKGCKALEIFD